MRPAQEAEDEEQEEDKKENEGKRKGMSCLRALRAQALFPQNTWPASSRSLAGRGQLLLSVGSNA